MFMSYVLQATSEASLLPMNMMNPSPRQWSFPLKRKTGKEMATLLDKFFKLNRPQKVEVDLGRYQVSLSIPNELKLCIHSCFRERILE